MGVRVRWPWLLVVALWASAPPVAFPSDYPSRPIRVVTGVPVGTSIDTLLRTLGEAMRADLGQPLVIDNRPGAEGIIAAQLVARAPADGYTLLAASHTQLVAVPVSFATPPYDVARDFTALTMLTENQLALVVPTSSAMTTLADLAPYAKTRPDGINAGSGSTTFMLVAEALGQRAGVRLHHVPYNGLPATLAAVMSGQVDLAVIDATLVLEPIRAGRLRGLAVTGTRRLEALPGVPTFSEAGFADVADPLWIALVAPAGLDSTIATRLRASIARAMDSPNVRDRLQTMAIVPRLGTSAELLEAVRAAQAQTVSLLQSLGVPLK